MIQLPYNFKSLDSVMHVCIAHINTLSVDLGAAPKCNKSDWKVKKVWNYINFSH